MFPVRVRVRKMINWETRSIHLVESQRTFILQDLRGTLQSVVVRSRGLQSYLDNVYPIRETEQFQSMIIIGLTPTSYRTAVLISVSIDDQGGEIICE